MCRCSGGAIRAGERSEILAWRECYFGGRILSESEPETAISRRPQTWVCWQVRLLARSLHIGRAAPFTSSFPPTPYSFSPNWCSIDSQARLVSCFQKSVVFAFRCRKSARTSRLDDCPNSICAAVSFAPFFCSFPRLHKFLIVMAVDPKHFFTVPFGMAHGSLDYRLSPGGV